MLAHVVVEVLDLVELDGAHGAHVGGPLLAAGFRRHAHSGAPDSAPRAARSHRHGQSHHARSGLGNGHGDGDGRGASGAPGHVHPGDAGAVQGHVALQQGLVGELLLADVALVGLLAAVQAHVDVERALLREALVADATLVRSHAGVRDHVFDEIILQRERSPADAALVRLFT